MGTRETAVSRGQRDIDPLRRRLLDAATRVFSRRGYDGTRILDIVKEAGLSTGAVYGRFTSKNDLLREAVVDASTTVARFDPTGSERVADLIKYGAGIRHDSLTDAEAIRLEAFGAARREPEVAAALQDADQRWRDSVAPLVEAARRDGTVAPGVDTEAVLFFIRALSLGLVAHRGAGFAGPDRDGWNDLIDRVVRSFGTTDHHHDHQHDHEHDQTTAPGGDPT